MKKYFGLLLTFLVLSSFNTFAGNSSWIAVATDDKSLTAQVSAVAARCHYFLLFDDQGNLADAIENPYLNAAGGAGRQAADFLAAKNVKVVIAGEFGQNMLDAMRNKEMTSMKFKGSAAEAVKQALKK